MAGHHSLCVLTPTLRLYRQHRDGRGPPDQWPHPSERIVKVFVYLFDCAADQGPTAVVRGSHRLPWTPPEVLDMASGGFRVDPSKGQTDGFAGSGLGKTVGDGFAALSMIPNHVPFAAKAGDAIVVDISTWHTAMQNTSPQARECTITSYTSARAMPGPWPRVDAGVLRGWKASGTLSEDRQRLLGIV